MEKIIQHIQFLTDRVILDYGNHCQFQLCKACKDGKHFKALINHFCPEVNLQEMEQEMAVWLEKKLFKLLAHGSSRTGVNREIYAFGEFVQERYEWIKRNRAA